MSKAVVIHHSDMDGRLGGYLFKDYFLNNGFDEVYTMECNYNEITDFSEFEDAGAVAIVDYSLKANELSNVINRVGKENVIWVDHHESAIRNSSIDADELKGIRCIGLSGCELAYIYINCPPKEFKPMYEPTDFLYANIPTGVYYAGEYDCWRYVNRTTDYERENPLLMKYGIDLYWPETVLFTESGMEFWSKVVNDKLFIEHLIEKGKVVQEYITAQNKSAVRNYAFECKLHKFGSLKAIALNTTFKSSIVFNSVFDEYEIGIVFNYKESQDKDSQMMFSIYRLGLNPSKKINCAKIAESYGGGGHASAAGFKSSGTLPFNKV